MCVDPLLTPNQRLTLDALVHEADLLVHAPRTGVEVVHLELDPVKADGIERRGENQPGSLAIEPTAIVVLGGEENPEAARAIRRIEVVQYDLADPAASGSLDDRQIDSVVMIATGAVPALQLLERHGPVSAGQTHMAPVRGHVGLTGTFDADGAVEMVPPDTNRRPSVAGREIRLGGRKSSASSCRDEVVAALSALAARDTRSLFTVRDVYTEMVVGGTRYAESTVFKTMQRMKEPAGRPPYMRLERVAREGFQIQLGA